MLSKEGIVHVIHEAMRAYCQVTGDRHPLPEWDGAAAWQRNIGHDMLDMILMSPQKITPEIMHTFWCGFMWRDGWVFGHDKSAEAKTHPNLRRYENLPPEQKMKARLYCAIVEALRPAVEVSGDGRSDGGIAFQSPVIHNVIIDNRGGMP